MSEVIAASTSTARIAIEDVRASAYTIPTAGIESDGTLAWDTTTLVLVDICAGGRRGIGYTYSVRTAAQVIRDTLAPLVVHHDAPAVTARWQAMLTAVRNLGRSGIAACAIAALALGAFLLPRAPR